MPIKKLRPEFTFTEDRLKELQQVVPEAFADGKVNWEALRESLGEYLEDETQEHFGLTWPGKREARRLATMPSKGTLVPQPGEGINEENAQNIFIEGENLEVLKLLQKSYAGRVKMIYIDPPYNTGNDFIYSDDYTEPLDAYLRRSGQKDEEGHLLTTNTRAGGRYHSNWLNMIFPRVLLAKNLLKNDGVLFVSIDDNEIGNLKLLCEEIFGEDNVELMVWHKVGDDSGRLKVTHRFRREHEYVLVAYKNKSATFFRKFLSDRNYKNVYTNPDNDPRGPYKQGIISHTEAKSKPSGKNYFTVITPSGKSFSRQWRVTEDEFNELVADGRIYFGKAGDSVPSIKVFIEEQGETTPISILQNLGTAKSAGLALKQLFNGVHVFDYPKPIELIRHLIKISTIPGDLVLDFFAGSCSTAEALLREDLTSEDGARQLILVQIPESLQVGSEARKAGYNFLTDIGKARIIKVLKELEQSHKDPPGLRCYSLQDSHYKMWPIVKEDSLGQVEMKFDDVQNLLKTNWEPFALLTEILLLQGFPLTSEITHQEDFLRNHIYRVSHAWHTHCLFVCLDEKVDPLTIANLGLASEDIFVCLDTALTDENKLRLADQINLHVI